MKPSIGLSLLLALALPGCQSAPVVPTAHSEAAVTLSGRAEFPGYALQATSSDVIGQATVSLIDAAGATRMAGVTNGAGQFTLFQSTLPFKPTAGDVFTLHITKRVNDQLLTLRSVVLRQAGGWTSITGGTIVVTMTTTALTKIDEQEPLIGPLDLMGKVDPTSGAVTTIIQGAIRYDEAAVASVVARLADRLANDVDPSGALVFTPPDGEVLVRTPEDIAMLQRYDVIDGGLTIAPDASPGVVVLPNLKQVTGSLYISGTRFIEDIDGLAGLRAIGGLTVVGNEKLADLNGLANVESMPWGLTIDENKALRTLDGLARVSGSIDGFDMEGNDVLATAELPLVTHLSSRLMVNDNPALATLSLPALKRSDSFMRIMDNPVMAAVNMPELTYVEEELYLIRLGELRNLDGLRSLTTVDYDLTISGNPKLTSLTGLANLRSLGTPDYTVLPGHWSYGYQSGDLSVSQNPLLTSLAGLEGLTVLCDVMIQSNGELVDVSALRGVTDVRSVNVSLNTKLLPDCGGIFGNAGLTMHGTGGLQVWMNGAECTP